MPYFSVIIPVYNKEKFIENLNRKVFSITEGDTFITLFIAKYNIITRELEYINAGHVPPVLVHNNRAELLNKGTTILGIFEELPKVEFGSITIKPDTTIVSFTDGLSEMEDEDGSQFGQKRLTEFALLHYHLSPETFNKLLYESVSKFKGNVLFNDDISTHQFIAFMTATVNHINIKPGSFFTPISEYK